MSMDPPGEGDFGSLGDNMTKCVLNFCWEKDS